MAFSDSERNHGDDDQDDRTPRVTSILVRFWREPRSLANAVSVLRSYVRDLHSGQERHFSTFQGLVAHLAKLAEPPVPPRDGDDG